MVRSVSPRTASSVTTRNTRFSPPRRSSPKLMPSVANSVIDKRVTIRMEMNFQRSLAVILVLSCCRNDLQEMWNRDEEDFLNPKRDQYREVRSGVRTHECNRIFRGRLQGANKRCRGDARSEIGAVNLALDDGGRSLKEPVATPIPMRHALRLASVAARTSTN